MSFYVSRGQQAVANRYGIYIAGVDGTGMRAILTSATRQLTHPRVSPDRNLVAFTRYTIPGADGLAKEADGYLGSEVCTCAIDGSDVRVVVPPGPTELNVCTSWWAGQHEVVHLHIDPFSRVYQIRAVDRRTLAIRVLPTPAGLNVSDPSLRDGRITFSVKAAPDPLWIMNADGGAARQITSPTGAGSSGGLNFGDYDSQISPDGERVAFMRWMGGWFSIHVLELSTGVVTLLSPQTGTISEGLPTWSPDGRRIAFVRFDLTNLVGENSGIFTMARDGSDRQRIPVPFGLFPSFPCYLPGDGSRVSFNAENYMMNV